MSIFTGFVLKAGESCTHYGEASENTRVDKAVKNLGFMGKDVACIESYGSVVELEDLRTLKSLLQDESIQTVEEALPLYLEQKNNPQPVEPEDPSDPADSPEARATAVMMRAMAPRNVNDATTLGLSTDDIITVSVFYDEWKAGEFEVGDIAKKDGNIWECMTKHNSTVNVDWVPGKAPTVWKNYHGKTPETALPWIQPQGAHDAYMKGECMIFTDDVTYRCLKDHTVHTPTDLPDSWEVAV